MCWPYFIIMQFIFSFLSHSSYFENGIPFKPVPGRMKPHKLHCCIKRLKKTESQILVLFVCSELQGPVVQSTVSLTSSLRVISLTVLADSIYNILIFFAEKI